MFNKLKRMAGLKVEEKSSINELTDMQLKNIENSVDEHRESFSDVEASSATASIDDVSWSDNSKTESTGEAVMKMKISNAELKEQTQNETAITSEKNSRIKKHVKDYSMPIDYSSVKIINDMYPLTKEQVVKLQKIAMSYSQGNASDCVKKLRMELNEAKGKINYKFWYMLMDIYQVLGLKNEFEQTAIAFAQIFNTSSPSWVNGDNDDKKKIIAGANVLTLPVTLTVDSLSNLDKFWKAAKDENFCRINVSKCYFEDSTPEALNLLFNVLFNLRKQKIKSFLMGDTELIDFCKKYVYPDGKKTARKPNKALIDNQKVIWNIYLEVLMWKGRQDEFDELSMLFAEKFELSPQGWEDDGVMVIEMQEVKEDNKELDKDINESNVGKLIQIVKDAFSEGRSCVLDFSVVDKVEFSTCGTISYELREVLESEENQDKEILLSKPNEMILTLFEMVGTLKVFKAVQLRKI